KEVEQRDSYVANTSLRMNAGVGYAITPALDVDLRYQFEKGFGEDFNLQSDELFFTRDLINRYSAITGGMVDYRIPKGGILDFGHRKMNAHNLRGQLNYDNNWGTRHSLTAILGAEIRKTTGDNTTGRSYGYDDGLKISSPVDYITRYQIYGGL